MLLDVPQEILNSILFYFDVDDPAIDNLSNSCQYLHSLLNKSIQDHLGKKYSRTLCIFGSQGKSTDPFRALRKILSRPRLALQFNHLWVCSIATYSIIEGEDPWVARLTDFGGLSESNNIDRFYHALRHLIFQSKYIPEPRKLAWFQGVKKAYKVWSNVGACRETMSTVVALTRRVWEASTMLLLLTLPGLQSFTVGADGQTRTFRNIVIQLGQMSRDSTKSLYRPLGKLSMFHSTWVDHRKYRSIYSKPLLSLIPFAMLPTMLTLSGTVSNEENISDLWPTDFQASTVTHLNLNLCKLSIGTLAIFLGRFSSLRSFKCCFGARDWGNNCTQNLSSVRLALLEAASSTLEILTIDSHDSQLNGRFGYIGSLCGFKVLKELSLDVDLLAYDGKFQPSEDMLPSSVEVLRVGLNSTSQQFNNFPEVQSGQFPALREVITYHRIIDDICVDWDVKNDLARPWFGAERCETCYIVTGEWRSLGHHC
ncbi:hypothetical protein MMC27_006641 [Xylographa pallens]|nr:hypothetical protein [Xylographa pallens]